MTLHQTPFPSAVGRGYFCALLLSLPWASSFSGLKRYLFIYFFGFYVFSFFFDLFWNIENILLRSSKVPPSL